MIEKDRLEQYIAEGFQVSMFLRDPTPEEIQKLPDVYSNKVVKALPLSHRDGRKLMYYLIQKDAIEFAEELVKEANTIIGYRLVVYCSGIGPDTIHGRNVYLDNVVMNLEKLLNWNVSTSSFPHTFQVSFDIEGDNQETVRDCQDDVRKVALALTLCNKIGFVVGSSSPGPKFKGQPFALTFGIQERFVREINSDQMAFVDQICQDKDTFTAASALQMLYCQVTDNARITTGWAAIEHIFSSRPQHLLTADELIAVTDAIDQLSCISDEKRKQLIEKIQNPDLIAKEGRNARIARQLSDLLNSNYSAVYEQVRSLSRERGQRVHKLTDTAPPLAEYVAFIERVLWAVIDERISGPNPFTLQRKEN
jgi:hypothetical protein